MTLSNPYNILADVILLAHFAFVLFVVLGMALIWIGYFARWAFIRNFWFRISHLAAIGVVAAESLLGVFCPLTVWENQLRLKAGGAGGIHEGSFVQYWVHQILFWNAHESFFMWLYVSFFTLVLLSFWVVKPKGPGKS